jgi:hypothetical protein
MLDEMSIPQANEDCAQMKALKTKITTLRCRVVELSDARSRALHSGNSEEAALLGRDLETANLELKTAKARLLNIRIPHLTSRGQIVSQHLKLVLDDLSASKQQLAQLERAL